MTLVVKINSLFTRMEPFIFDGGLLACSYFDHKKNWYNINFTRFSQNIGCSKSETSGIGIKDYLNLHDLISCVYRSMIYLCTIEHPLAALPCYKIWIMIDQICHTLTLKRQMYTDVFRVIFLIHPAYK